MKRILLLLILVFLVGATQPGFADDLEDLELLDTELEADEVISLDALDNDTRTVDGDDLSLDSQDLESNDDTKVMFTLGGYLKGLAYWNQEKYSDLLWEQKFGPLKRAGKAAPADQDLNGFNNVGTRLQLKLEGYLSDRARMYSAVNMNFNSVGSLHETEAKPYNTNELRLIEGFVEIYDGRRIWKIGSQIVTWSFLEGMDVPTDRVNARDYTYKSTEYEDRKVASAGVLLRQNLYQRGALEVMYIPVANTNVGMEFQEYFYTGVDETIEPKPNAGKWAVRFCSSLGNLDYAISYVEGPDRDGDLVPVPPKTVPHPTAGKPEEVIPAIKRQYHKVKSPGLDLQFNFGSWLGKASYVRYLTEDEDGDSLLIKNRWSKTVMGGEFSFLGQTVNLYAGQQRVENFKDDALSAQTNFLLGQIHQRIDFISGHINANFLPGNALNLILMAAGYWNEEGDAVQTNIIATATYKIADGLEVLFSPTYMDLMDNRFVDCQAEVKYSF